MSDVIQSFIAGHRVEAPFTLLFNDQRFDCEQILRWLPARRLVVKVVNSDGEYLLKLFSPGNKGQRDYKRELRGYEHCIKANLPTPKRIFYQTDFSGCLAIAYEYLQDATPYQFAEQTISKLFELMSDCHQAGLYQEDIHMDNLLDVNDELYLIDMASIKGAVGQPLNKMQSMQNLAVLIAQFFPEQQQRLITRLSDYFTSRNWNYDQSTQKTCQKILERAWNKRKDTYLKKCFRACTMTVYEKNTERELAFKRDFYDVIENPSIVELESRLAASTLLKKGNSATVGRLEWGGKHVVIKRYNIKSRWHWIKRFWRPSRAANAWKMGNLLNLIDIPTPQVLGFVEERVGPFRKRAYLITECLHNAKELNHVYSESIPPESVLKQVKRILKLLKRYKISHGDMKASNFLLSEAEHLQLIDLDAMTMHCSAHKFKKAFEKDKWRFGQNWSFDASLVEKLEEI